LEKLSIIAKIVIMKIYLSALLVLVVFAGHAQKVELLQGDLKILQGKTALKTVFTYDNMIVGDGLSEKDYIAKKKKELNEKEPGRGETWEKAWVNDRAQRFEPKFRELFEKYAGLTTTDQQAAYTLIFNTNRTEPGFNAGGMIRSAAVIDADARIVDSSNPSKVLVRLSITRSTGNGVGGFDFDAGTRLQEAYAKAGKGLGRFIKDKKK
jgi:hypothetical protein